MHHCEKYRISQILTARRNILTGCTLWSMLLFFSSGSSAVTISASNFSPISTIKSLQFHGVGIGYVQLFCTGSPEVLVTFTTSNGNRQGYCDGNLIGDQRGDSYYKTVSINVTFTNNGPAKSVNLFYGLLSIDGAGDQSLWTNKTDIIPAGIDNFCSIDINTSPTIPVLHPASDVDITGIISNPVGAATVTFKPGHLSDGMQKGVLRLNSDNSTNGYYSINNKPVDSNGEWVVDSDSNPFLHVRSVHDADAGEMTGLMTATIACP